VLIDSGACVSAISEKLVKALDLKSEPCTRTPVVGIGGRKMSTSTANFTLSIGGRGIDVYALVVPNLPFGLLIGMNKLKASNIDIMMSKRSLWIGKVSVMFRSAFSDVVQAYKRQPSEAQGLIVHDLSFGEYEAIEKDMKRSKTGRIILRAVARVLLSIMTVRGVSALAIACVIVLVYLIASKKCRSAFKRMARGEKLNKDDFWHVLRKVDHQERRVRPNELSLETWQAARWEAYCKQVDVDVVITERFGHEVFTGGLMRWREDADGNERTGRKWYDFTISENLARRVRSLWRTQAIEEE